MQKTVTDLALNTLQNQTAIIVQHTTTILALSQLPHNDVQNEKLSMSWTQADLLATPLTTPLLELITPLLGMTTPPLEMTTPLVPTQTVSLCHLVLVRACTWITPTLPSVWWLFLLLMSSNDSLIILWCLRLLKDRSPILLRLLRLVCIRRRANIPYLASVPLSSQEVLYLNGVQGSPWLSITLLGMVSFNIIMHLTAFQLKYFCIVIIIFFIDMLKKLLSGLDQVIKSFNKIGHFFLFLLRPYCRLITNMVY